MSTKAFQVLRVPSLLLAAALQIVPVARPAVAMLESSSSLMAIIFRWAIGAAATMGAVDAVSGASTVITSPLSTNIVQGKAFSMRLTTAPMSAGYWAATGLPPGLALSSSTLSGTPTTTGIYNVGLTAKSSANAPAKETTTATLVITVTPSTAAPPVVVGQPGSLTVTNGQSAAFVVTATGTAPLAYQWLFNGTGLSGQTSSNLVINPVLTNNAGSYSVVVTNSGGSVTSSTAGLTVIVPVGIATQPANQSVISGQSGLFTVAASGTSPITYQWRFGGVALSGQTGSSLVASNAGNYDVVVSNMGGSMTSAVATLTLTLPAAVPTISSQPTNLTVNAGSAAAFFVSAGSVSPLSYQWRLNGGAVNGQTNSTLTINPASSTNAGSYDVVVNNSSGSVTSVVAVLTVLAAPSITNQPSSQSVATGGTATLSVGATGAGLSYQWRLAGTNLAGKIASSLVINPVTTNSAGSYVVVVSNSVGSVTSAPAVLTVVVPAQLPAILSQPASQSVAQGQSATFAVTASSSLTLGYQWRLNGVNLTGKNSTNLIVNPVSTNNAGNYVVVVTNVSGAVTSSVAVLSVIIPPSILSEPVSLTTTNGRSASFAVTARGTAPFTYQWLLNGGAITGQTASNLVINPVAVTNAGTYSVVVSNSAGGIASSPAVLTVLVPPAIVTDPVGQSVVAGATAAFQVSATGTSPLGYQWRFAGNKLPGQNGSNLVLSATTPNQAGNYDVVVTNAAGSVTSSVAVLTLILPPSILTQPLGQTNPLGTTAGFSVLAASSAPATYQWLKNGIPLASDLHISGAQSNSMAISGLLTNDAAGYSVVVANAAGSVTSQVAVLSIKLVSLIEVTSSGTGTVSPNYNGQSLRIGYTYTMTASPAAGWVFGGWSGTTNSDSAAVTFVMQNAMVLHANFVPSPFIAAQATYSGLFYEDAGVTYFSAGSFVATTTRDGGYSGTLQVAGNKFAFSGQFDSRGRATNQISRSWVNKSVPPLLVEMQLDLSGASQITGHVTDGNWTSSLLADGAASYTGTNGAPQSGSYTVLIAGAPGATDRPAGHGYATVKISPAGKVTFYGMLADGTPVTQTAALSKTGAWPLYLPLYPAGSTHQTLGLMLGWLSLTNLPGSDISGAVTWSKPQQPSSLDYGPGFVLTSEVVGSKYLPPAIGVPVLNLAGGQVAFADGALAASFTNRFNLSANNLFSNQSPNAMSVNLNRPSGVVQGRVVDPATGKPLWFRGVLMQKQNSGGGFFLNEHLSGSVYLTP